MTYAIVFAAGALIGWRAPAFVTYYRYFRPRGTRGRAIFGALLAALGINPIVQ